MTIRQQLVGLVVVTALMTATALPAAPQGGEQADKLRRETATALAALRPVVDAAEVRWRRELVGKVTSRTGQPLGERELMAEIRRARESLAEGARIDALWTELTQRRLDLQRFADELDAIFEQAVVTTWDVHVMEARRMVTLIQQRADTRLDRLADEWSRTVAPLQQREGLSAFARQQSVDAAAAPIAKTERDIRSALERELDAVAQELMRARQQLVQLATARADAARAARRPRAPERLRALIESHFESGGAGATGSSFDAVIDAAQVRLRTVVLRAEPNTLRLADRVQALTAGRTMPTAPTAGVPKAVALRFGLIEGGRFVPYAPDAAMAYDKPFAVQVRYDSAPPYDETTVMLTTKVGGRHRVAIYKLDATPEIFESRPMEFEDPRGCRGTRTCDGQ